MTASTESAAEITGPWIKSRRKAKGLNQRQLAEAVGVTQGTVSNWETGRAAPSPQLHDALRSTLGDGQLTLPAVSASPPAAPDHGPKKRATRRTRKKAAARDGEPAPTRRTRRSKKGKAAKAAKANNGSAATGSLGFEDKLWGAADLLRNNMDPAEYKHVVLGLIFLKYISDAFEERREAIEESLSNPDSDDYIDDEDERAEELAEMLEDRDEYTAEHVFWVPPPARWSHLQAHATQAAIGTLLDDAMEAIEADNPRLKNTLPKIYGLPNLDKHKLGELINLVSGIGLGSKEHRDKDTLGRVYEYFLAKFASAEGKGGGEFYTPASVVRTLVEMLEPFRGRVYDPCCGSGGMFVQSLKFIDAHGGRRNQVTVYGQESNRTTWRMARMNMAIRGIEAKLGERHADSFHSDLHPDLRADYVLANPPFNISAWGGDRLAEDVRWKYGTPPTGNANFAWLQHIVHHLAPNGTAGVVLANGSMSSMTSGEGDIRRALVENDLVDCMVAMPGQLFYATGIPVCLWFLAKNKAARGHRDRQKEILFIDARKLGRMETRVHRVFDDADVARIADTYHAWRTVDGGYEDVAGFCKSATLEEVQGHDCVLTPGRYVGAEEVDDDGEPFEEKMERLTTQLAEQMAEGRRLDGEIRKALDSLGYGS